ncbi:TonB-dependent receptor [Sinimarinibacterium thermocellulolyticum]|uniref:TonB-dependent receptor n=1 Tax=Sinimarinibacterium thermocellulolyticum TaxID=3170016 RepID=A0ABV2A6G8_9GAMM
MRSGPAPLQAAAALLLMMGAGAGAADELDLLLAPVHEEPAMSEPQSGEAAADADDTVATLPVAPLRVEQETRTTPSRSGRVVEEIVVTAQKTEQSLQDVPISVSAIGGAQIRDAAISDAQELMQYTPNVKFAQAANFLPTLNIRGFGSPPLGRNLEPSVGLAIDEVFYGRSTFIADAIFDVDRVEVLRGPQGTLFGKNTIAGVLSFTTAQPHFEPSGFLTAAVGSLSERRLEGGASFGLIDDVLAARVSFRARDRKTGMVNTMLDQTNDAQDYAGRIKLRWYVGDATTADLGLLVASSRANGTGFELQQASERSLTRYRQIDPDAEAEAFNGRQSINEPVFSDRDARSLSLKLNHDLGQIAALRDVDATLILADALIETPYLVDTDFSPIDSQSAGSAGPERYRQRSFELRTSARSDGLFGWGEDMHWIAGIFGLDSASKVSQDVTVNTNGVIDSILAGGTAAGRPIPQIPLALQDLLEALGLPTDISDLPAPLQLIPAALAEEKLLNRTDVDATSLAVFVQGTWSLTERLDLIFGYRYGRERKQGSQSSQCQNRPVCTAAFAFAGQRNFSESGARRETERSPKLAVSYAFNDAITGFANVTRGFKSGGFSGPLLAPNNLQYGPEQAMSYEAGIKSRLLDRSLVLNAAVYRVEFDDLQVNLFDGTNISTINAASAVSQGLEIDFQWLPPIEALTLAGSLGFTDVAYGAFVCGPAIATDTDTAPECNPNGNPRPPPTQDLTGRQTPFTPRISASFTPSLRFLLWPRHRLGAMLGIDVLYQGEQYLDADLDPASLQKATTKLNARLAIAPASRRWALVFNAKNLTGVQERVVVFDQPQFAGNYATVVLPDEPLYALDLRYNFGQ